MSGAKRPRPAEEDRPAGDPRVYMAAERTLLAWIRTGLSLMGFGFVVARFGVFLREVAISHSLAPTRVHGASLWLGVGLVVLGIVINVASAIRYGRVVRRIDQGRPYYSAQPDLGVISAMLLAIIGAAMGIYLVLVAF